MIKQTTNRWPLLVARKCSTFRFLALKVIVSLGIMTIAWLPVFGQKPAIEEETIRTIVTEAADVIRREYFDEKTADKVATELKGKLAKGSYLYTDSPELLAQIITKDIYDWTHDKHLALIAPAKQMDLLDLDPKSDKSRELSAKRMNYGLNRVEILEGNVGYLNVIAFYREIEMRDSLLVAMKFLRNVDALIIDVRENGGGSPEGAALLLSFFCDTSDTPLFEIVTRNGEVTKYATYKLEADARFHHVPTCVLTSKGTFSAGEGFAYLMQERGLAEVVGEVTAGAANPGRPFLLNSRFEVVVPTGRVVSESKQGNWEGNGVEPDVLVSSPEALGESHARAIKRLLETTKPGKWRESLEAIHNRRTISK